MLAQEGRAAMADRPADKKKQRTHGSPPEDWVCLWLRASALASARWGVDGSPGLVLRSPSDRFGAAMNALRLGADCRSPSLSGLQECMCTFDEINEENGNYCEYQTEPSGDWHPARYSADIVKDLIDSQVRTYVHTRTPPRFRGFSHGRVDQRSSLGL